MKQPDVDYPTCILGYVQGPVVRVEALDNTETFLHNKNWLFFKGPMAIDGVTYAITHMQKTSWFGFLWMRPFCFHFWLFAQKQKVCAHGSWVPGSEFGKYIRIGLWRWQPGDKNGNWIGGLKGTIYLNFSFHWD